MLPSGDSQMQGGNSETGGTARKPPKAGEAVCYPASC